MAFIHEIEPERGDSKATLGLSRLVTQMTNGQYIYVDQNMLDRNFPNIPCTEEKLEQYFKKKNFPDIIIGRGARWKLPQNAQKKATLIIDDINEILASKHSQGDLVPHDLKKESLTKAGKDFKKHYPHTKGPLVAIMMGGYVTPTKQLACKLIDIACNYPEITFFLCPSRRTGGSVDNLKNHMNTAIEQSTSPNTGTIETAVAFNSAGLNNKPRSERIEILSIDYDEAISDSGYNPYLGLLDQADHIVVAGESFSLVSEALFTGKNIYVHCAEHNYFKFKEEGYVSEVNQLDENAPFPTRPMPPLDSTHEIAKAITEQYEKNRSHSGFNRFLKKFCPS